MARNYDLKHWSKGKVSLLDAFGISGTFKFPKLGATLPAEQAQSQQKARHGNPPKNARKYSQAQLQALWIQAGGDPSKALMASAIAMAESRGETDATDHDSNGTVDRGLWQINSSHGHQSTYDPLKNARAAVAISDNGTNWGPWSTFGNGDYRQFM